MHSPLEVILLHALSIIIEDAEELGADVKIYNVEKNCWLLSDKKREKTVAVGLIPELKKKSKKKIIGAMEIKIHKLNWASAEGFTYEDMIDKELGVFEKVYLSEVANVLAGK